MSLYFSSSEIGCGPESLTDRVNNKLVRIFFYILVTFAQWFLTVVTFI